MFHTLVLLANNKVIGRRKKRGRGFTYWLFVPTGARMVVVGAALVLVAIVQLTSTGIVVAGCGMVCIIVIAIVVAGVAPRRAKAIVICLL